MHRVCVEGFVDGAINGMSPAKFNMALGGVEVRITGYVITFPDCSRKKYVLCRPALMRWQNISKSGN